jgi:hypothetical protein
MYVYIYVCVRILKRNNHKILTGSSEGMKTFRKRRRRWEDTIKIELKNVGLRVWNVLI